MSILEGTRPARKDKLISALKCKKKINLIAQIDEELFRAIKILVAKEGMKQKVFVENALKEALEKYNNK